MLVELEIHAAAGVSSGSHNTMVLLKEKNGERTLPIMMSVRRSMLMLMRAKMEFPMTIPMTLPDLNYRMMQRFGINLVSVEITDLKEGVFFCRIVGEREGERQTLNLCMATDGIVMAAIAHCPIMIEEELLQAQYMHKMGDNSFALNINVLSRSMLEDALKHAVENEQYEAASHLRDELMKRPPLQE